MKSTMTLKLGKQEYKQSRIIIQKD